MATQPNTNPARFAHKSPSAFRANGADTIRETDFRPEAVVGPDDIPVISGSKDFEDFIYLLSHDLRNSVRALLEVPQWIKEDLVEGGQLITGSLSSNLGLLENHARRLDRMLVDLLAYSRVGRKQSMQSIYLDYALETVILELNPPSDFKITSDLKCKTVRMGEQDVLTLISALISNAIKHHDQKSGSVHISSRQDGNKCVICVRDDGPGIPEEFRAKIFDAMTTLKPRDEIEGSGMGLAIVRKIVDLYSGELIWPENDSGNGTALEIHVPI